MTANQPPPYPGESNEPSQPPVYGSTPPPPGAYPPPAPGGYGAPEGNKKALASMIVGIASLVLGLFCGLLVIGSIVAVVLGFIARNEIKQSGGRQTGSGQALTGIITGFVLIALFILAVVLLATGVIDYGFTYES